MSKSCYKKIQNVFHWNSYEPFQRKPYEQIGRHRVKAMKLGVGTDILSLARLRSALETDREVFLKKVYTAAEVKQAEERPDPTYYFATRFAGKEAVFKCLGDGSIRLNEIEILDDACGKPRVVWSGNAKNVADAKGFTLVEISLSFETAYAVAFAVASGD